MTFDVNVLLFGPARELVGQDRIRLKAKPVMTTSEVMHQITEQYPVLKPLASHCVLAVGQQYRHHDERIFLESSTEIALIPPISGG
uniref:Molybdopterin synthase sulfur carrier subunit n=1 Tax=Panagrolaimus sp. JU765 TaxID=591449 RepID=A0AC34QPW5_9BILA